MKNIFEDAKFGDIFKTRDGRKAIFLRSVLDGYYFIIEGGIYGYYVNPNGYHHDIINGDNNNLDIISRWGESIDEDKLNRLADESSELYGKYTYRSMNYESERADIKISGYFDGYKDGYRKAKEE